MIGKSYGLDSDDKSIEGDIYVCPSCHRKVIANVKQSKVSKSVYDFNVKNYEC